MGTRRFVLPVMLALLANTSAGIAAEEQPAVDPTLDIYASPVRLAKLPDGRRMNVYCAGVGSPTVVLESGLGNGGLKDWRKVQLDLAKKTRVCSYDRAGISFSDPGPFPRDNTHIASDLHELLNAVGEAGPFLLVGHSMGGVYTREFARRYPESIAGIVLVESAVEGQLQAQGTAGAKIYSDQVASFESCLRLTTAGPLQPGTPCVGKFPSIYSDKLKSTLIENISKPTVFQTLLSEFKSYYSLQSDVGFSTPMLANIPLTVLYIHHSESSADADRLWEDQEKRLAALSSRGTVRLVPASGHFIQLDQPQAVIPAIDDMVDSIRDASRPSAHKGGP
jgi:pimeloyl-ACP methyl ester carboxylesterase